MEICTDAPVTSFANRIKGGHLKKMDVITPENYPSLYEQANTQPTKNLWGKNVDKNNSLNINSSVNKNNNILNKKSNYINNTNNKEPILPLST